MYYSGIKYNDIANGTGVRTTLFVSGCRNHCKDCFQPETWEFENGEPFDSQTENEILESLKPAYISGLTLLGGDPFEPGEPACASSICAEGEGAVSRKKYLGVYRLSAGQRPD